MSTNNPLSILVKGTSVFSLAFVFKAVFTLLIITILSRHLSAAELGLYFILLQAGTILSQLCQLGVDQGSQKFVAEAGSVSPGAVAPTITQLQRCIYVAMVGVLFLIWTFWSTIHDIWLTQSTGSLFLYQAIIVVTITLERSCSSFLRALERIKSSAIADALLRQTIIGLSLSLFLLTLQRPLSLADVLTIWSACGAISVGFGLLTLHKAKSKVCSDDSTTHFSLGQMLRISAIIGLSRAVSTIRGSSDMLILGWTLGPETAGLFGPLKRIASLVMALMPTTKMLQPMIAKMHADNRTNDIGTLSRAGTAIAGGIGLLILVPFMLAGPWLLEILFGAQYRSLNIALLLLLAGPVARQFLSASLVILQMTGRHASTLGINIAFCIIALIAMPLAAKAYGLIGLAAVSSLLMILRFSLFTYIASRHLNTNIIYRLYRRSR